MVDKNSKDSVTHESSVKLPQQCPGTPDGHSQAPYAGQRGSLCPVEQGFVAAEPSWLQSLGYSPAFRRPSRSPHPGSSRQPASSWTLTSAQRLEVAGLGQSGSFLCVAQSLQEPHPIFKSVFFWEVTMGNRSATV